MCTSGANTKFRRNRSNIAEKVLILVIFISPEMVAHDNIKLRKNEQT